MKIKKGDKVRVIAGKDKGQTGIVERVYQKNNTVLIPKINQYKRHIKKNEKLPQGGVVDVPRPIDAAKLMLVCSKCTKTTRAGYIVEKKKKFRICKKCKSKI